MRWLWLLFPLSLFAQTTEGWQVDPAQAPYRTVSITTNEGTWMNLDISPDGKTIAFDLLGDIYTLPIAGGNATLLREGHAWESQPRYSPDGKSIAFTSDAGGGDNIWVMDANGKNAHPVTDENFRLLNNPAWTPDGQYLVARKHFTSERSLGAGELWLYHTSGGSGLQLTKRKNDQQDVNEPCVSPDGRYIYYSEDVYPGGYFQYNKDPNSQIYVIKRYNRETGDITTITGGPGGACRPQLSRNGEQLAFVRRVRTQSVLFIHDLATGAEKPLFDGLSKDQQEAWAIFGAYTGFAWTPDDQHIIIWGQGKLWKVNVATATAEEISFTATANHSITEALHFEQNPAPENFTARVIRHAVVSPDGNTLVFSAVGRLWSKKLPNGKPTLIPTGNDFAFEPQFSPDGSKMVYVTWNDTAYGAIWSMRWPDPAAIPQRLTTLNGILRTPQFSPDGQQIVFQKEGGNMDQGYNYNKNNGLYVMPASGGEATLLTQEGIFPRFNTAGDRIYYQTGGYLFGSLGKAYKSVNLRGEDERTHFTSTYTNQFVPSPDGKWVAFNELFKVYIAPFPQIGSPIDLHAGTQAIPVAQVTKEAGINLHWSADSDKLYWTLGEELFSAELTDHFAFLEGAAKKLAEPVAIGEGIKVGLELPTDKPEGTIAFTNARIITMKGDEVIEGGTLVVTGNRIQSVGASGSVAIPDNATVIDATGKTIMPGMIDVHAHANHFRLGLNPQKHWPYYANLAYGVTTMHDPSANTEMVFGYAELVKAGRMVGPRVFSTGIILYGADGDFKAVVNSLEDARAAVRRTKAFGAFSVKSYNQPRREQRQQVIQASREEEIMVVPEGGSFFYHNMSMILDGHTGVEHNIPVVPAYDDVVQLWGASNTGYTPTLIVNYGGLNGEYYFYQHSNVWEKDLLLRYTPRAVIDPRARHRTMAPEEEYDNGHILVAESCKKLADAGVKINLGAHGQLQGLGAHWELWMFVQGGMTPLEAIRAATLNGAYYIGMDRDLGSLEQGKLADLIVMDDNPLEDIRNTESITHTMVNGRLYEVATMNEIGNYNRPRTPFFWETMDYAPQFEFHFDSNGFMQPQCHCHQH